MQASITSAAKQATRDPGLITTGCRRPSLNSYCRKTPPLHYRAASVPIPKSWPNPSPHNTLPVPCRRGISLPTGFRNTRTPSSVNYPLPQAASLSPQRPGRTDSLLWGDAAASARHPLASPGDTGETVLTAPAAQAPAGPPHDPAHRPATRSASPSSAPLPASPGHFLRPPRPQAGPPPPPSPGGPTGPAPTRPAARPAQERGLSLCFVLRCVCLRCGWCRPWSHYRSLACQRGSPSHIRNL